MENEDKYTISEVYLADGDVKEGDDGLVWKTLLREGTWRLSPDPNTQRPVEKPMFVRRKGPVGISDDHYDISLEDIVESFENKAVDSVTVPTDHGNKPLDNTGYVRRLKIIEGDDGSAKLAGGIEFTEPDVKEKALRGSLPGTSCGLLYNHVRKEDGKVFPIALEHSALTPKPWINGMEPFGAALSEDDQDVERLAFSEQVSNDVPGAGDDDEPEAVPADGPDHELVEPVGTGEQAETEPADEQEGNDDVDEDDGEGVSLSDEPPGPKRDLHEAQSQRLLKLAQADEAKPSPAGTTTGGGDTVKKDKKDMTEAEIQLSEKLESQAAEAKEREDALRVELSELRKEKHNAYVDRKIEELKGLGLDKAPGFLKEARRVMLADDGGPAVVLNLSEDGGNDAEKFTATQIVERLIDALPKKDEKIVLSEQALVEEAGDKPAESGDDAESVEDRTKKAKEFLSL